MGGKQRKYIGELNNDEEISGDEYFLENESGVGEMLCCQNLLTLSKF